MYELSVTLHWQRSEPALRPGEFSSAHTVRYNEGTEVAVDAAPDWGGDAAKTNPEQALAAAVSSCHMMTFLALAAKAAWPIASFEDRAVASGALVAQEYDDEEQLWLDLDLDPDGEDALMQLQGASIRYRIAVGPIAGGKTLRLHTPGAALEGREQPKPFTAARDGFSLNVAVA